MIGIGGFGQVHLTSLRTLAHANRAKLVAFADPTAARLPDTVAALTWEGVAQYDRFEDMIARDDIDAVIIATPIFLHVQQTVACLAAGKNVYLEKPPCPTLAEYDQLEAAWRASGKVCAVGFQMQAAPVFAYISELVDSGKLGTLTDVWAAARWPRDDAYYSRASWSGRYTLNNVPVFDGPATNALAHVVHATSAIAGAPVRVRGALKRARPIESFDTAYIEAETEKNVRLQLLLTHATQVEKGPIARLRGTGGEATFDWDMNATFTPTGGETIALKFPYQNMVSILLNFIDAVETGSEPATTLPQTLSFLNVVNGALQSGGGITSFDPALIAAVNDDTPKRLYTVAGLDADIEAFTDDPAATPSTVAPGPWVPVDEIGRGLYGV
jgi:predicted dehydrogenase